MDTRGLSQPPRSSIVASVSGGRSSIRSMDGVPFSRDRLISSNESLAKFVFSRNKQMLSRRKDVWTAILHRAPFLKVDDSGLKGISARVSLTAAQIHELSILNDHILGVTTPFYSEGQDDQSTSPVHVDVALQSVGLLHHAFPSGYNGSGIGIWTNDGGGRPDPIDFDINLSRLHLFDTGNEPIQSHATKTVALLQASAPSAMVHFAIPNASCNLRAGLSEVPGNTGRPVFVSSISNNFSDHGTVYSLCSMWWDLFIANNRLTHFAAAGNIVDERDNATNVVGASKAYNTISVGSYRVDRPSDPIAASSCHDDPATRAMKPELMAPGHRVNIAGNDRGGTSYAAPIAAGFAASMMEMEPAYRMRPALVKAVLMANARDLDGSGPKGQRDGAGAIDFWQTRFNGGWRFYEGSHNSYFSIDHDGDGNKDITFAEHLVAGTRYRIAISWLNDGIISYATARPSMDIDLEVRRPGAANPTWTSWSQYNSLEIIEFTAIETGWHSVTIDLYDHTSGDLSLGYAFTWL